MKTLYLDYMATTPVDERVIQKMNQYLGINGVYANPSSVSHAPGQTALTAVELAREQVARVIGASASELIFTSGATESNNVAILGAARFYQRKGKHLISMQTEHPSVLEPLAQLEREGFQVTYLPPQPNGLIAIESVLNALTPQTIMVSILQVNNEVGVIQPIAELGAQLKGRGIVFHVDAAQSVGKIPVDVQRMNVDLMSLSSHKNYGPKGVGALYIRGCPRIRLFPIAFGGGQERGLRPGTLATHQIVGMGEAFELGEQQREADAARSLALRERLWQGICHLPGIQLNGDPTCRVAGNLNVSLPQGPFLSDLPQLAASAGSACASATHHPSYVLKAMGIPVTMCLSAIRFSLGRFSTEQEIDQVIAYLTEGSTG